MNLTLKCSLTILLTLLHIKESVSPPPRRTENEEHIENKSQPTGLEELGIEYERYLKEVIDVLESDPQFKRKLEAAEEADIRTGKIAHELDYVDHRVRTKLDEVKRQELERLRHLAQKEFEITNGIDIDHMKISPPEHLDHENPHTFEIDDLKKLIAKITSDLNEADKKRRHEFKEYEMQKEFEKQEKLKNLEGEEKEKFEKQLKDNETKHKEHDPLHHPGSKQQLEEVWEKQDHMGSQEFNPKVFFQLHDLDGNGYWDQNEVKALFLKELDKMYQMGAPEDDMRERAEELERMREHVFSEADKNKDQLLSYDEFLQQTKQPEFEKDPGWETVDQKPAYTHEEYLEFERRRQEEIQRLIQQGLIPPRPVYNMPVYQHPQQFQQGQHQYAQQHPGQAQYVQQHPGQPQYMQQHPGQAQYAQQHPGQAQYAQQHPGQPQYAQQHPGQIQYNQQNYGQLPQGAAHHPQPPQPGQYPNHPSVNVDPNQHQNPQNFPSNLGPNAHPNNPSQSKPYAVNDNQLRPNAQSNNIEISTNRHLTNQDPIHKDDHIPVANDATHEEKPIQVNPIPAKIEPVAHDANAIVRDTKQNVHPK